MPEHIARLGDPVMVDGTPRFNAWCVWCDAIDTGTFPDLFDRGWLPSAAGAWNCPEHAPSPVIDSLPWRAGPNTFRAVFEPFPEWVRDRSHWDEDDELERAA